MATEILTPKEKALIVTCINLQQFSTARAARKAMDEGRGAIAELLQKEIDELKSLQAKLRNI